MRDTRIKIIQTQKSCHNPFHANIIFYIYNLILVEVLKNKILVPNELTSRTSPPEELKKKSYDTKYLRITKYKFDSYKSQPEGWINQKFGWRKKTV